MHPWHPSAPAPQSHPRAPASPHDVDRHLANLTLRSHAPFHAPHVLPAPAHPHDYDNDYGNGNGSENPYNLAHALAFQPAAQPLQPYHYGHYNITAPGTAAVPVPAAAPRVPAQTPPSSASDAVSSPPLPPDHDACLTDSDIAARALAASGLNVSAPEFVPSFAVPPLSPPQVPRAGDDAEAGGEPGAYGFVLDPGLPVLAHSPASSSYADASSLPCDAPYEADGGLNAGLFSVTAREPPERPSPEAAVSHFEQHFPALSGREEHGRADAQRALGWRALQDEEAAKARDAEVTRRLEALHAGLLDDEPDLCDFGVAGGEAAPMSADVGAVWVSTGRSVGALYETLRSEAAEHARVRNRFFDRATAAFKKGDGAAARKLGALGREANAAMKELHRKAADAIFDARNPPGVTDVVDLHGLHVAEALERLPGALARADSGKVRILTGTGHHTKGTGRARLRPAVKKWLQDAGYFFEEVIDANEYVGSFIVERS